MAEDLQAAAAALLAAEYSGEGLEVLLRKAEVCAKGAELYAAASVHDARALRGRSWQAVAAAAQVSDGTARSRWRDARVRRQLDQWAGARPHEVTAGSGRLDGGTAGGDSGDEWSAAQQDATRQMASALEYLHRVSGLTLRTVAARTERSRSYISRVLSGDRMPSWEVLQDVTSVLGGEPEELRLLWEMASGYLPPSRQPVHLCAARFHAAVRGLHLAAGCPDPATLASPSLPAGILRATLEGRLVPDWVTTGMVVTALQGRSAVIRPLWEAVHYAFLAGHDIFPHTGLSLGSGDLDARRAPLSPPAEEQP